MSDTLRTDVTIVIPVFGAVEETIACIDSILASDGTKAPIIVNDDGSAAYVGDLLRRHFANVPNVLIRTSFRNRGYTANVQYGVEAATTRYVAIVNSDTLFPRRWLNKLAETLDRNPALAAVGPLSNAASYQSIPNLLNPRGEFSSNAEFGRDSDSREAITRFLEAAFAERTEDTPILNGFCTLFRAHCLRMVGGFDPASFPTGYGEENDVCMRLMAGGYRLAVRLDCFVHHLKSRSFGDEKKREYSRNGKDTLNRLYGEGFVQRFATVMAENPVLNALRFTIAAAFRSAENLDEMVTGLFDRSDDEIDPPFLVRVTGPGTLVLWQDCYTYVQEPYRDRYGPMAELTLGGHYLHIVLPVGRKIAFSTHSPLKSALGVLAVQSATEPLAVRQVPSPRRNADILDALERLEGRFLYYSEDFGRKRAG